MLINQNIYDIALHHIGNNIPDAFVVIIGAMDGVSFDETRGYIAKYNWSGLFVEPIKDQFDRLKLLYNTDKYICENSAISTYSGKIQMLRINQQAIDSGAVHSCFGGMSAIYPPKNGLASDGDRPVVEKYGELIEVNCITLNDLFNKHNIEKFDIISIDTEGHDLAILKQLNFNTYKPKVIRIEYINLNQEEQQEAIDLLVKNGYVYNIIGQNLDAVEKEYWNTINNDISINKAPTLIKTLEKPAIKSDNTTIVTGIWDLGRDNLSDGWSRNFEHYINKFSELLQSLPHTTPLVVFIDPAHENIVWKYRSKDNTRTYSCKKEDFNSNFFPFFEHIQKIRNNPNWYNQVGWLKDSTQAKLEWYNPMVMCKMFMLHNAKCFNPFNTDYFFWLDGGITNTVHSGYFSHDKVLSKIENIVSKFLFVCFPYKSSTEIHGFDIKAMNEMCNTSVDRVARGGFFGGHKDYISEVNSIYYSLLNDTLARGYMGTEESIFTIMSYQKPDLFEYSMIKDNGLIGTFFESLKNNTVQTTHQSTKKITFHNNNIILYINTFNTPKQLQLLIDSFEKNDKNFLTKTKIYLIDNSTDSKYDESYLNIVNKYNFNHLKNGNLGVCGARQFAAEHFADLKAKYMLFFEDDMLLDFNTSNCPFGFNKNIYDLFNKIIRLMDTESYDFIKLSFSEFYGHNGDQWAWHNVPQHLKEEYFDNCKSRPKTLFKNIKSFNGLPYADGEVYYSNWPHIIGQEGNKKCFLDTTWAHPYEQTWMSHMYTLTKENKLNPAILLASPITHNRVYFYEGSERKES
jgi:FkbM family methyltransferase